MIFRYILCLRDSSLDRYLRKRGRLWKLSPNINSAECFVSHKECLAILKRKPKILQHDWSDALRPVILRIEIHNGTENPRRNPVRVWPLTPLEELAAQAEG